MRIEEFLEKTEELKKELKKFEVNFRELEEGLKELEAKGLSKTIPPFKLDKKLIYSRWTDDPSKENIPVMNLSLAIFHLGELASYLRIYGHREEWISEFEEVYSALPLHYRKQLEEVYKSLQEEIKTIKRLS